MKYTIKEGNDEYIVFDAIRDNKGEGLNVDELQEILKKTEDYDI